MTTDTETTLHCSFCAKSQHEVTKLIGSGSSPSIYICNECVDICHDIVHPGHADDDE